MLLPVSYKMDAVSSIIMMAGIYYGAQYGGSTTSILLNIPGEASSIVTCLDGYQLARKGRAGAALGISAFGSFIGGTLSVIGLMFLAPLLVQIALQFGPPEFFSLTVFGLTMISYLTSKSLIKSLLMGTPNPDIEKRLAFNPKDLETFSRRRALGCLSRLPVCIRLNQRSFSFCEFLSLGTNFPLVLSLSAVFCLCFHPSGHKLSSKDFRLIPLNNSNFSKSIINFRTVSPACFTIRPAT
jgi:tripartite tricarboxylate transporter TctA family protein